MLWNIGSGSGNKGEGGVAVGIMAVSSPEGTVEPGVVEPDV